MSFNHAVVWLDHNEAHVLHFNAEAAESEKLKAHPHHAKHSKSGDRHTAEDVHYFPGIAAALSEAKEILIAGPGQEKIAFARHLQQHVPAAAANVVGVETVDHPTDGQLLAYARKYFKKADLFR